MSLKLSKGTPQVHQCCLLPRESPAALRAADGPMLVQARSSMSKLVRKPTQPGGFTQPSDMKRNARASTFTLSVYWEIRKTTDGSQCVSLKGAQVSFFKQPSGQLETPGQGCVFKKFMGPALLWNAKKHKRWSLKSRAKNAEREDSLGLR